MEQLMDDGISKIYCGHYPYIKKILDKQYIKNMQALAEAINNGIPPTPQPFETRKSSKDAKPMITTQNGVSIVYEPSKIK